MESAGVTEADVRGLQERCGESLVLSASQLSLVEMRQVAIASNRSARSLDVIFCELPGQRAPVHSQSPRRF